MTVKLIAGTHRRTHDLSGQVFGRWTVEGFAGTEGKHDHTTALWFCLCSCGTRRKVKASSLKTGSSKSCGCIQRDSRTWTQEKQRLARKAWRDARPEYRAAESKRWRLANPERAKLYKRQTNYRTKYGLDIEGVEQILLDQAGKCAICSREVQLGGRAQGKVDHDHATGQVRGILCSVCNTSLGGFRDDPVILASAILYLDEANRKRLKVA